MKEMFEDLAEEEALSLIRKQVESNKTHGPVNRKGVKKGEDRRGKSKFVIDWIHYVVGENHLDCRNAEGPCLLALIKTYMPKRLAKLAIQTLHVLVPALYPNRNTRSQWFKDFKQAILSKFGNDSSIKKLADDLLHLTSEERKLINTNYSVQVAQRNANQIELSDTKVLEVIAELRAAPAEDYIAKICLVALCVGSRISEVTMVSNYIETEKPHYIRVIGVSKERKKQFDEKGQLVPNDHKRDFVKPIIMLQSKELIDTVVDLRTRLERKYGWDLGRGHGSIQVDVKKVTGTVDPAANVRIREIFGPTFVFHYTRAIYAQMAFVQYGPVGMSQTYYISQVLGHKENSLTTSLSYQTFAIRRKLKEDDPDLVSKITNLEVQFDHFVKEHKKKKRSRSRSRSRSPNLEPAEKMVRFTNKQGVSITLKKQPARRESQEARMARLRAVVAELEAAGIKPTYRAVSSLGFGGRSVHAFFKELKAAQEEKKQEEKKQSA